MIDLTNRTIDEVNQLIQKYSNVLELIKIQEYQPYLAVIIDIGIKYIKENHNNIPIDWKQWSIVYLKYQFTTGKIKKESDIPKLIDEFIKYYNEEYKHYVDSIAIYSDEYERDFAFVWHYIQKNR